MRQCFVRCGETLDVCNKLIVLFNS